MNETEQAKVTIKRSYRARVEELWALWTSAEGFASWWGPEGFRVDVHKFEAREGGEIVYDMVADAPEAIAAMKQMGQPASHSTRGRFTEFKPVRRLTLVHVIDFIKDVEPYDSTIEVEFHQQGEMARMVVILHPHRDPHWTRMSVEGFTSQLGKLDRRYGWTGQ